MCICSLTLVAELAAVAHLTVAVGLSAVRDLAVAVFALQFSAWVEELLLLVTQGSMKTLLAFTTVRLHVHWNTPSMDTPVQSQ